MSIRCLIRGHQWKLLMHPSIYLWVSERNLTPSVLSHGIVCMRCKRKQYK